MPRTRCLLLALLFFLLIAPLPISAATRELTPETAALAQYLHDFDRHAHASVEELKAELATPLLMARSGYGGPAETQSLTRAELDQSLTMPLAAGFELQRVEILATGPTPVANLVYKIASEAREVDLGVFLARDANSWKVAAIETAPPFPDSSLTGKFLKTVEQSLHGSGAAAMQLFAAPMHRIATRGTGDVARPDLEKLTQDQAAALLGLPLPARARLVKADVLASYVDGGIAELQFKNAGSFTRALVLMIRPEAGWKIVAVARE